VRAGDVHPDAAGSAGTPPERPFDAVRLSDIESLPLDFAAGLQWRPVRQVMGIEAFGINAYVAPEAGIRLIEEHDELGGSAGHHEELYVVVAGRARFEVAGETIDAPAVTFVAVHDPAARRGAIAEEAGTIALAIGGRRGEGFEVSAWEYSFRAVALARLGRHDDALAVIHDAVQRFPSDANLLYNAACVEGISVAGDPVMDDDARAALASEGLSHLDRALELDPTLARYLADDPDLASLRARPGFPSA